MLRNNFSNIEKPEGLAWWFVPIISATQKAEIKGIMV
jgi:hypothetical protein